MQGYYILLNCIHISAILTHIFFAKREKMETNISKLITQSLLFTPDSTPTPEFIRQAMAQPTLHHRTSEFESIFKETRTHLAKMLGMPEILMLASSGTGAMEALLPLFLHARF